jgi:hypothetical protein
VKHTLSIRSASLLLSAFPMAMCAQDTACIRNSIALLHVHELLDEGRTEEALATFDTVLHAVPWRGWTLCEATSAALTHGDTLRAIRYLEDIYRTGNRSSITYFPEITGWIARGFEEPHLGRLLAAIRMWEEKADTVWIRALEEMYALDQSDRSSEHIYLRNDSINLERLVRLTGERGFPTPAIVGGHFGKVDLLLWHHRGELGSNERLTYFTDLARRAMANCAIPPSFLCGAEDFEAWEDGRPMPYGTLIGYFSDLTTIHLPERVVVNANRKAVGLGPIEGQARMQGIPLSDLPFGR